MTHLQLHQSWGIISKSNQEIHFSCYAFEVSCIFILTIFIKFSQATYFLDSPCWLPQMAGRHCLLYQGMWSLKYDIRGVLFGSTLMILSICIWSLFDWVFSKLHHPNNLWQDLQQYTKVQLDWPKPELILSKLRWTWNFPGRFYVFPWWTYRANKMMFFSIIFCSPNHIILSEPDTTWYTISPNMNRPTNNWS